MTRSETLITLMCVAVAVCGAQDVSYRKVPVPGDCQKYGIKLRNLNIRIPYKIACPEDEVFSVKQERCVPKDSVYNDQCPQVNSMIDIKKMCDDCPTCLFIDKRNSAWFFNCSKHNVDDPLSNLREFEDECKYPQVFDKTNMLCTDPLEARSIGGPVPYDACGKLCTEHEDRWRRRQIQVKIAGCRIVCCFRWIPEVLVRGEYPCSCNTPGIEWKADPKDCSKFYRCVDGKQFSFNCASSSVWDPDTKTCVQKGSHWDKCTKKQEPCSNSNTAVEPKSDHCAQYHNCSSEKPTVDECPYPMLFSEQKLQCEHFSLVECGNRYEVFDPCEYRANQCQHSHCIPCHIRFPSCRGLPDGMNHWVGKEWSPYYVVCSEQRIVRPAQCTESIFNSDKRMCEKAKKNTK